MKRILFLCTGNSARSQLAEALMRQMCRDSETSIEKFEIMSAGMSPETVDPRVYEVLNYHNVNSENLVSVLASSLQSQHFDVVITLCDKASKECALFPDSNALIHWDFKDPKPQPGSQGFYDVFDGLKAKIALFLMLNGDNQSDAIGAVELFKIMGDPLRLRILMLIHDEQALSVGDLTKALQVSQPKVSRHLALLRDSGVLHDQREGVWVFYHFPADLPAWIRHTLDTVRNGQPALINEEKRRLSAIINRKKSQSLFNV